MYSSLRSPSRTLPTGESRSAKKNFDSPKPTHLDSTRVQFTPHLRSNSPNKHGETSPSFQASRSIDQTPSHASHAFSNDILRSASQHQPRSAAGKSSPFNSRHLSSSHIKPTLNEFTLPNSPLSKSTLVLSPTHQQNQSTRRGGSDVRESASYANAMKALQNKIKSLEKDVADLKAEKTKQADDYQHNLNLLQGKQAEERSQFEQVESRLKTRLELAEHELREKTRYATDLQKENDHLKEQLLNSETDRKKEYQASLAERNQFKVRLNELERMAEAESRRNKEAKLEEEHLIKERENLRSQIERLQEKCMKLEKDLREKDINYEWKVNELTDKNAHLEKTLKETRFELQNEFEASAQREKELKQRIDELTREKIELSGQVDDLRAYARERDTELNNKSEIISKRDKEVSKLKSQLDSMIKEQEKTRLLSDVTQNYAQDVADVNERLLATLMESTRNKSVGNFVFPDGSQQQINPYSASDTMHVSDLEFRGQPTLSGQSRLATAKFNTPSLKSGTISTFGQSPNSKRVGFSAQSKQTFNPVEHPKYDYAITTERSQPETTDRFSFSNTKRATVGDNRKSSNEIEYENLIKVIVNVEKELLDLTKEYQILNSDLIVRLSYYFCNNLFF